MTASTVRTGIRGACFALLLSGGVVNAAPLVPAFNDVAAQCAANMAKAAQRRLMEEMRKSVVLVSHSDGSEGYTGSGAVVWTDPTRRRALILTVRHLFEGRSGRIVVTFYDGRRLNGSLFRTDSRSDLALIFVRSERPIYPVDLDSEPVGKDEKVIKTGYRDVTSLNVNPGKCLGSFATNGKSETFAVSNEGGPGDSGSAILRAENGRLAGLVWGGNSQQTYCVSADNIQLFLSNNGVLLLAKPDVQPSRSAFGR